MSGKDVLVVLMRWPQLGTGKSRLAAVLGAEAAHRLHRGFVADTLDWSAAWPRLVAFNPPGAADAVARAAPGATLVAQPAGDLGDRLAHAFAAGFALGARRVVLVGSDSPTLPGSLLEACIDAADGDSVSLVGADDGGFVAMAVPRAAAGRLPEMFHGVEWSTERTAAQVAAHARAAGLTVRSPGTWYDVDDAAGLERLAGDIARDPGRAPRTAAALAALRPRTGGERTPWVIGGVAAALLLAVAVLRWVTFHSDTYDLAFFDQVVWNASAGHGLRSSFVDYGFFGQHFEPALLLFVPLYRLHPTPLWLLAGQSLALGLAVVPLWALAREWLAGRVAASAACAAYLLSLGVARAAGFDFHTEALAVPFVFLALLGAARGNTALLLAAGAVPTLCKEDGALVCIGIGALAFAVHRRRAGLALAGGAAVAAALVTLVLMPRLRGGAPGDLIDRYRYLGATPAQVVEHLVTAPQSWIGHVLSAPAGPALLLALAGVGLLPLLRPAALAACLPGLLLALLSADPYQPALRLHYGLPAAPLLVAAALAGWRTTWGRRLGRAAPALLVGGAAATWLVAAPLPWGPGPDRVELGGLDRVGDVDGALAHIPAGVPVAASGSLLPHLAERAEIWELPAGVGVDWVAVDSRIPPSAQSRAAGYDAAVASLPGRGYRRVAGGGGVTVWLSRRSWYRCRSACR